MNSTTRKPSVVILIPTYNSASTVVETLQSILQLGNELNDVQSVVIADDGSSDNTLDLVEKTWQSPVQLIIRKAVRNRGEYTNVNEAVASMSDGVEWFCIMHSDNLAKPGWVRMLAEQARKADARVGSICTSWDNLLLDGRVIPGENLPDAEPRKIIGSPAAVYDTLLQGCWWHNSTAAIRVEAFRKLGGMPAGQGLRQKGDWDFLLRMLVNGFDIIYLPRTLMIYRDTAISLSAQNLLRHLELLESDVLVRRYSAGCPVTRLVRIYTKLLGYSLRKIASSIVRGQGRRLIGAIRASGILALGFVRAILSRGDSINAPYIEAQKSG